jgi:hypothetical protein
LINLLVERLKLEYHGKQKKQNLMQGCLREREILAQLKDCETPDTAQEVLKKDEKNKKGAAPNKQVKGT